MLWLTTLYFSAILILSLYGAHRLLLVVRVARSSKANASRPLSDWPHVCIQLPLYNEKHVAERLLRSIAAIEYPRDRMEIQVLDDSQDETTEIVDRVSAEIRALGTACHVVRRSDRKGYKAGALKEGLKKTSASLIAIFDADFLPSKDFLLRTIPYFSSSDVGFVQARWAHLNRRANILTRAQAVLLDCHFFIEHPGRYLSGCCFNFNGTAGVWRASAIEDAGNWQGDTLTEDLDLSYRAYLKGWRGEYLLDVACPAELPETLSAYKSQQRRWSKGSMQVFKKLFSQIIHSDLPLRSKIEAFFHLSGNFCYILLLFVTIFSVPVALWRMRSLLVPGAWFESIVVALTAGSLFLFFLYAMCRDREAQVVDVLSAFLVGIGISAHCSLAALSGLLSSHEGVFERTPKSGSVVQEVTSGTAVFGRRFIQRSRFVPGVLLHPREVLIFLYLFIGVIVTFLYSAYLVLPFILLLAAGYTMVLWCGTVGDSKRCML